MFEPAVFAALLALHTDPGLLERAIAAKARDTATAARLHRDELAATEAELNRTEAAIERCTPSKPPRSPGACSAHDCATSATRSERDEPAMITAAGSAHRSHLNRC